MMEFVEAGSKYPLASSVINVIEFYYTPALVAFGALGNCLSVYVVFATKMRRTSSSFYLAALALSDTGFLLSVLVNWLGLYYDVQILNQQGFCQFLVYLTNVCSFLSSWFVVAFTVERFVAVCYPLRRQWMCTVNRAKILVGAVTLVGLLNCCPVLLYLRIRVYQEKDYCGIAEGWEMVASVLNYLDTLLTFALPFSLIVILNSLIVRAVWHVDSVRTSLKARASTRDSPPAVHQVRVTKMLLIVSSVFFCLNLPAYAMRVYAFIQSQPTELEVLTQRAFNILFNTNFGISFGLYCASGQNFRSAVGQLFHCHAGAGRRKLRLGRHSKRSFTNQTNQIGTDTIRISGSTLGEQTIMYDKPWRDTYQLRTFGSRGMPSTVQHHSTDLTEIEDCYSSVDFSEPGWKNTILEE